MRVTFCILLIIKTIGVSAQYFHSASNFYMNGQFHNPAYAGSREVFSSTVMYRNQWTGLEGAPKTMNFSFHTPLKRLNIASGFTAFNDQIGVSRLTGLAVNYVYRIRMKEGKRNLAFGLKTGLTNFKADLSKLQLSNQQDDAFNGVIINQTRFDVGFGIYYYAPHFFISLSSPTINRFGYNAYQTYDSIKTRAITTYFTTGFVVSLGKDVEFMPSIYFKSIKNDGQIDLNFSFQILKTLLIGVSLRSAESLVMLIEYQINPQFRLGFAHDFITSPLQKVTMGTNEITLRYELVKKYHVYSTKFF
ncbi:MAG: type IX secretion system membrane protein PorP/SprF [Bacteroidales bacterium]|nr:type IX secretion system membrane protein PorP/SprF [Bacteroidales bacterium]